MTKSLSFRRLGELVTIHGGPFAKMPGGTDVGVCLLEGMPFRQRGCNQLHMPIPDFSVPEVAPLEATLLKIAYALGRGLNVYAGCLGGQGRTGTFLACVLKAAGEDGDPVKSTRLRFSPKAVETKGQENFIRDWQPSPRFLRSFKLRLYAGLVARKIAYYLPRAGI